MKKTIILTLLCLLVTVGLFAANTKAYTQKVTDPNSVLSNMQFPDVTNGSTSTAPGYVVRAWITTRPAEVTSTLTHAASLIRLYRFGNGGGVPYDTRIFLQFSTFTTNWALGETVHIEVTNNNVSPALTDFWEIQLPLSHSSNPGQAWTVVDPAVPLDLWPVAQDHWTYNLQVNGPAGIAVAGPGTYAGTMPQQFSTGQLLADNNDLLGSWLAAAAPAGFHWQTNPIVVDATGWAGAKVDHVYSKTIEFVPIADADTYTLNVNAMGPATPIYKDAVPTGQTTNHAFTGNTAAELTGTYTLEPLPAGWHWEPASITVVAGDFTSSKSALQVWGTMSNGAKVAYSHTITFVQTANPTTTYTLNVNGPDGYAVTGPVAGTTDYVATDSNNMINDLVGSYTIAPATAPSYWAVNPIVVAEGDFVANVATINFVLITVNPVDPTSFPAYPAGNVTGYMATGAGIHDLFIARQAGEIGALAYIGGAWLAPDGAPDWTWLNVNFDAKAPIPVIIYGPTLPVELSSFTGTMTAEYFVQLNWTSQSETSLLGYRVLRSETADVSNAVSITPTLVTATNTSTTQNYSITDTEVENNTTYSYWLESVNMDGTSEFHGPVNVLVQHEVPPVLPEYTSMRNAYPNPFAQNSSTNLEVSVKAGETGTVTIYNILGQVVKTYTVREGLNNLKWNGKDSKGNTCGSGIYFARLSTPSMNQTKKMVIFK